jgi:hypothetical protein
MALSILDGNQTATTLSTIVTSGQHIPAHTIVSLGTQAVTDISTAVGLLQSAVATQGSVANTAFVKIGGHTGTATTGNIVHVSSVGAMKVDASASTQPISGTVTANVNGVPNDNGIPYFGVGYFTSPGSSLIQVSQDPNCGLPINGTVTANLGSALPAGTNRIGVVTIGAGTVTIGAGTAQIGSVTASISNFPATQAVSLTTLPALVAGTAQIGSVTASISGTVPISISSVTVGNSVTIGSLPAISGTVTANLSISSTVITSGSFTSLASATLVPANTARKMATVYNLGAGQLFINAGVTATTLGGGFMVALSSGDFYECDYTTTTLSAIFATAGTASWMSH